MSTSLPLLLATALCLTLQRISILLCAPHPVTEPSQCPLCSEHLLCAWGAAGLFVPDLHNSPTKGPLLPHFTHGETQAPLS